MEKRKPHYSLKAVQELARRGKYEITQSARQTAFTDFGFKSEEEILAIILGLTQKDFYKSMTSHFNSSIWQDVYHKGFLDAVIYLKVQIKDEHTVVISFKKK